MSRLDAWILRRCEGFAHALQRQCGVNCFHIAKLFFVGVCCLLLVELIQRIVAHKIIAWDYVFNGLAILACCTVVFFHDDAAAMQRLSDRLGNPRKITDRLWRYGCLCMSLIDLLLMREQGRANVPFSWLFLGALYFAACDPLPPSTSKLGNWLRSLRTPRLARETR
jgi:hypothetical protein